MKLDGKIVAAHLKETVIEQVQKLSKPPVLVIIPSNDLQSRGYLESRKKLGRELGIEVRVIDYNPSITEDLFIEVIKQLSNDSEIDAIIIDRPYPPAFSQERIVRAINVDKDADGIHPQNIGLGYLGDKMALMPATAQAVLAVLDYYNIAIEGANAVVIGRSITVGKPAASLLLVRSATVTIAHSKTRELKELTRKADIVVAALNKSAFIDNEYINPSSIVIDCGIHYNANGTITGDVDGEAIQKALSYTPVPGGIGPVTNVVLFQNVIKCYTRRKK